MKVFIVLRKINISFALYSIDKKCTTKVWSAKGADLAMFCVTVAPAVPALALERKAF